MRPGPFQRVLRRRAAGRGVPDVRAALDCLPGVVLTAPAPEVFVLVDGLAVRAVPGADPVLPGDVVELRCDAGRLVASCR